jgi:propionyl-CoA carboxylase alpha chain
VNRLARALREYRIAGVPTTIPFCLFVIEHPRFLSGDFNTRLVDEELHREFIGVPANPEIERSIAAALALAMKQNGSRTNNQHRKTKNNVSGWKWAGRRDAIEK